MDCYTVTLITGESSDYTETVARVFSTKEKAEQFAIGLRERLDQIGRHRSGNNSASNNRETRYRTDILDGINIDYNGAWVSINGPIPFDEM